MVKNRVWGLDLLRAAAILAVLILHSQAFFFSNRWASFGWAGVDLFFVLSGYLVGRQGLRMGRSVVSLREFWVRRWSRTFPLYFLVLAVYLLLKPALGYPFQAAAWPYFLFIQNFFSPADFVQSWSLCVEEQFYFIFPLLLLMAPARAPALLWLFPVALSVAFRWQVWQMGLADTVAGSAYHIQFPTYTHLDGISLGVFLAATEQKWTQFSTRIKTAAAALGAALLLFTGWAGDPGIVGASAVWLFTAFSVAFALLLPWAATLRRPKFGAALVEKIALWSYGIYLWNNLVFRFAEKLPFPPWQQGVLAWAATILISALTYRFVEVPGLRWRSPLRPG